MGNPRMPTAPTSVGGARVRRRTRRGTVSVVRANIVSRCGHARRGGLSPGKRGRSVADHALHTRGLAGETSAAAASLIWANRAPFEGLPSPNDCAKWLRCLGGDVAEWLKAAVC